MKREKKESGFPGDLGVRIQKNLNTHPSFFTPGVTKFMGIDGVKQILYKVKSFTKPFVLYLFLASVANAQEQYIKDVAQLDGSRSNLLRGVSLVVGLNGVGDSPKGATAVMIKRYLANLRGEDMPAVVSKNVALVIVESELPPYQKQGTKIDVMVSAIGDAKSLEGGTLLETMLIGPNNRADPSGDIVYAIAQGRLVVEGDPKKGGNPTSGVIPRGAIVEKEVKHNLVKYNQERKFYFIKLDLKKADVSTASLLADTINGADSMKRIFNTRVILQEPLATVPEDGGTVHVRIPSRADYESIVGKRTYPNFINEPAKFAEVILNLPFTQPYPQKAKIVLNDTTKIVTATKTATISPGRVQIGNIGILLQTQTAVQDFLGRPEVQLLTPKQLIDVIKALEKAGLINAEVITE